ncbi:MAG: Smr/MutS family protein [Gammaproteobacteria bacterium]|nr:Smr/MutS family protein [Gammaproteobacteria bacterium]MDH4252924.1 Smr/MutS family protein [Gammaproteobacteria bacterium]MDH5308390.1 Smr/MutS family protein [Gammaproteobacteria bacterium]
MSSSKGQRGKRNADISKEDVELFRKAMRGVQPLVRALPEPAVRKAAPKAKFSRRDQRAVLEESLQPNIDWSEAGSGDALRFERPSVGRRTMRKLSRGGFSVQAEIDLHGLTAAEANAALRQFIEEAVVRGWSCVRIIHGKGRGSGQGGPILKRKVDSWLRQWSPVLAFVSARQVDGGTGAVYVLLNTA